MIIKARNPNLRHVSRTHRVALLDWLFDRINLDTEVRIRYVDSKNQLANTLTKGHFTHNEWRHLLCLFNISLFSSQNCAEFNSQNRSEGMAKRQQEGNYDEWVVSNSKPVRNFVSRSCAGPSTTPFSTVSSRLGIFGSEDHEMRWESRAENPAHIIKKESFIERDQVTNSQERHQDIRSRATTRSRMTREPSQTTENPTTCTGRFVPIIEIWDAGNVLETKKRMQYSFCPFNLIQRKSGWEAANGAELSSKR